MNLQNYIIIHHVNWDWIWSSVNYTNLKSSIHWNFNQYQSEQHSMHIIFLKSDKWKQFEIDRPKRKNLFKDITVMRSQLPISEKKEVYLSNETAVDLSKEKEVDNFSMNLVPSSQFEHDDTNPDR